VGAGQGWAAARRGRLHAFFILIGGEGGDACVFDFVVLKLHLSALSSWVYGGAVLDRPVVAG
jgi:hypothetical protein